MPGLSHDYWPCPFCDKGIIEVLIRPKFYIHTRTYCGSKGSIFKRMKEMVIVTTEKCPNCGELAKKIEKEWREEGLI